MLKKSPIRSRRKNPKSRKPVKGNKVSPTSSQLLRFWKISGPGLVTGASDDDPSGIATYSQAGAAYGLSTLWTALITFPLMASLQEMCTRIGLVTSHGLAGTLKTYYRSQYISSARQAGNSEYDYDTSWPGEWQN